MTEKAASLVTQAKQWASRYGEFSNGTEGAVLTVPLRVGAAWASHDADTLAELYTEDGSELIGDIQLRGREEIRAYLAEAFAGSYRGSRLVDEPVDIKLLTADVAVAVTEGGIVRAGEEAPAPENSFRATWVVVRRDGDWRLFSHQTSPLKG
ncbi:SgcJ/EcaC family oxidoreductase [Kitasatospora sp. SUK 42]|uniref:SgcJ/EcaC family oxidoreductase n=1 Tax=Kitasatospora sp. SUK 42 TaxID=1588882 RepID=UPI0018CB5A5B|nr:SgcJ/EcaC family oxidoreductase [Kitasatospora sp. SUK 42]MBV2156599.1 SgcJ/EcaC family oxidoreductase [Kitasatospora sp. SUK 42]